MLLVKASRQQSAQRTVNDSNASLVSPVDNVVDISSTLAGRSQLVVDLLGSFNSGLAVELSRVADLCQSQHVSVSIVLCSYTHFEQHVLHHVGTVWTLKLPGLALEEHVVDSPYRS